MKTEGRQTKLLAAIAVFAMVVCALAVVLPSAEVTDAYEATDVQNGTVTVSNETDLRQALADNTVSTIVLGDNITGVDSVLTVGKAVTIDGDGHTITAVESETFKGEWISGPSKYLISVEGSYNVSITDLILDNSGFAFGLNVYGATVILNGVDSINSAGAGFVIGGSGSINATDVSAADNTWGGINIDTSGSLTLDNIASVGSVYSETGCTATITDGAPVEVTGTWNNTTPAAFHGYYASIADTAKNLADTRLTDATITIKQNLALTNNETIPADVAVKTDNGVALTLSEGVILTISEGASFNGTVAGPDGASVALTGFVAGDDGATLTGGSVTISGTIDASSNVVIDASNGVYIEDVLVTSTTTTAGGLTITVTPDEEGVAPTVTITNVEIGNGASMSIENGANVELSGTISVAAAQGEQVAGSLDIAGAVTGTGSIFGAFTMAPNANVTVNYDDEDVQDYEGSYNALAEGITSGSGVTGTWSIEDDTLILDHYTGNLYFYTFNADGFSKVELIGENVIILDEAAVGEFFDPTQATRSYFGAIRTGATDGLTIQSTDGTGSLEIKISSSLGTMSGKHVAGIMASSVTINADVAVTNTMTADDGVTISTYGIKGGVDSAGDVTVGTGVTVNGDINADTLTMTDATVNGNTDANTFVFNGNVNIDSIEGSFTIGTYATVIVDDVVINAGEAITNNGGALIIMNSLSYTAATGAGNIMVYNGVAQQVLPNNIYLASGATFSGNVTPVPVENAVDGVIVNNVVDANREIALGNDVTIVSIDPVNIDGLVGADDVTVTIGTIYGTNNTLAGTIVTNNLGYKDSDNAIVSATINGMMFNAVTGTGMSVTGTTVQTDDGYKYAVTVEGSKITGPVVGNGITVDMNNISSGTDGITFMAGSVIVSGTIQFDGQTVTGQDYPSTVVFSGADVSSDNTDDGLVFEDLEVTGRGTVMVDRLTIRGDVTIGTNVTLLIASGSEIIVDRDAVLGGTGTVDVRQGGSITVNGIIESTVNIETTNTTTVNSAEEFVSALPYYTTIELGDDLEFFGDDWDGQTVTVQGKTINMGTYGIYIGEVGSDGNVTSAMTLEFVNTTVNGQNGIFEVRDGSVLGIDGADIYADVEVGDEATLELANNVTDITGASTELRSVGFGKVINFSNNYNMASGTQLSVYGTLNVNDGYTLTVDSNAGIQIMKSGSMTVDGTLVVGGVLQVVDSVKANMVVNGNMSVTGTVGGTVSNYGTIDFDGKSGDSANDVPVATIDMFDGATLNVESVTGTMTVEGQTDYVKSNNDRELAPELDRGKVTLAGVEGVTITASQTFTAAVVTGTDLRGAQISVALDVSGVVTAGTITVDREFTYDDNADVETPEYAPVTFSETVSLADETRLVFSADNKYLVEGTINAADGATITNSGEVTVTGTVTITAGTARDISNAHTAMGDVNAVYYDVTTAASGSTPGSITRTYTGLSAAIDAADGADDNTVHVIGDVEVAEGVTVTVPADVDVNGNNGNIDVKGTLTFENFRESYAPYSNPNIDADVRIEADPARTYTSLANAIEMGQTDITLNRVAHITEDLLIPAGTTVRGGDGTGIYVEAAYDGATGDVTLTVEGALILYSNSTIADVIPDIITDSNDERYDASVVVAGEDGFIYVPQSSNTADIVDMAGAHYLRSYEYNRATYNVYVVSTVMHAAADSENVALNANSVYVIMIKGQITVDSVEFTAPEDASDDTPLIIGVADISSDSQSSFRFNQVILGNAVILSSQNAELTGAVVMQDADGNVVSEVDFNRALGAMVGVITYVDDETGEESDRMAIATDGFLTGGTVTVSAGTVYTDSFRVQNGTYTVNTDDVRYNGVLSVANGATLVVSGGNEQNAALNIDGAGTDGDGNNVAMTVDGTLVIEGTADVDGAVINGTVTVQNNGKLRVEDNVAVNGTIDVVTTDQYEDSELIVKGVLTVGAKPTELGVTGGAGTVNGVVTIQDNGYIRAYPGADLSEAQINVNADVSEMESMAFVINGETYMTVYVDEADDRYVNSILDAEQFDLLGLDVGLNYHRNYSSSSQPINTGLYQIGNWYSNESMAGNTALSDGSNGTDVTEIVDYDTVYAHAEPATVTGTFSVGVGLRLYVDDVPVTSSNTAELTVGTHSVRFELEASYNGDNAVISFNGQTVQNGGTITVGVTDTTFNLTASGAVPATPGSGDITVNVPSSGDDGMSLTDILLIVLVILILVMAIIVALRLMRS